jgi:predicted dehydrogenase
MPKRDPSSSIAPTSRRGFLKTSATAAGALVTGGLALQRSAHATGDDTLKVGLVGCGGRGSGAAVNALSVEPKARLTAMADAFADRLEGSLERIKKQKPDQVAVDPDHRFSGFDAYQGLLASGVDVVILATPPHFRPAHLEACVAAGKHVFCEKPVAVDAPGVRRVLATCEAAKPKGLSIVSGLCWRYHDGVRATMARVLDGAIGRIVSIQETYDCGPPWFRNQARQPNWTEMEYQLRNWYPFTWLSGDHNVEQHVHSLDKASWLMHDEPPVRAWGMGGRQVRSEETIGQIFDHHAVVYEYPDGVQLHSYCRRQAGCANDTSDNFFGTDGHCDVLKNRIDGKTPWRYDGPKCNMYEIEHRELFASIRDAKPINNGLYMARSTMLAILGRMVTYTGQAITWEQAINSKEDLSPAKYAWDAEPPILPDASGNYPMAVPGVTKFA